MIIRRITMAATGLAGRLAGGVVLAEPPDGTVLCSTSFDEGAAAEWGSLAGAFVVHDSDGNGSPDVLRQTGGEACTLVFLADQGCAYTAQGVRWNDEYLNDYEVVMHGRGGTVNIDLLVAILNGLTDTVVPRSKHEAAQDWLVANGYPRVFALPADPHIRDLPDSEFPDVPSNHYCHSLATFDTFMDHMPPVPPVIVAVTPPLETVTPGSEYHKQLRLMQGTPPVGWAVLQGPIGIQVDATGLVSGWMPEVADLGQTLSFRVHADNSAGSDAVTWQARVLSASDFDKDGDVDQADFGHLQRCLSGHGQSCAPNCIDADFSSDGDVDEVDFSLFQPCLGGLDCAPGCSREDIL